MKHRLCTLLALSGITALTTFAAPTRPIRSDNFQTQTPCGPMWDPMAQQGQWFVDSINGSTNVSTWEFHDDINSASISGVVQNIQYAPPGTSNDNILAFDVFVTVMNDLPNEIHMGSSSNSHSEVQIGGYPFYAEGTMHEARITAEFAIADPMFIPNGTPPNWPDPLSGGAYHIEAQNENEWAWYCWNDPTMTGGPGDFQVPTWNLVPSTLPPGGSSTALMSFIVTGAGMPIADYRHSVIRASQWNGLDLLYNRHRSLKISHWLDTLLIDYSAFQGTPPLWEDEPVEYIYASDASVFYRTTPADERTPLQINLTATNQSPDWVDLSWTVTDAINYQIQYCDTLSSNTWKTVPVNLGIPPSIPSAMNWIDDGSIITNLPVQQQPQRFYRLTE